MIEEDIILQDTCTKITSTKHHEYQCCIDPKTCKEKGFPGDTGMSFFIAGIMGQDLPIITEQFQRELPDSRIKLNSHTQSAFEILDGKFFKLDYSSGKIKSTDPSAEMIVKAALIFYSLHQRENYILAAQMMKSHRDLIDVLINLVEKKFKLPNNTYLKNIFEIQE